MIMVYFDEFGQIHREESGGEVSIEIQNRNKRYGLIEMMFDVQRIRDLIPRLTEDKVIIVRCMNNALPKWLIKFQKEIEVEQGDIEDFSTEIELGQEAENEGVNIESESET